MNLAVRVQVKNLDDDRVGQVMAYLLKVASLDQSFLIR